MGDVNKKIEQYRMAYAEAGYPHVILIDLGNDHVGIVPSSVNYNERIVYNAIKIVEGSVSCFPCWVDTHTTSKGKGKLCRAGNCQSLEGSYVC